MSRFSILFILPYLALILLPFFSANAYTFSGIGYHQLYKDSLITPCPIKWQDAIYDCPGRTLAYDIDRDSIDEIIGRSLDYFHITKFNPVTQEYEKIFVSDPIVGLFGKLYLANVDGTGLDELLISGEHELHIFNLEEFTIDTTLYFPELPAYLDIKDVVFADGDNDGEAEIILSTEQKLAFVNVQDYSMEQVFDVEADGNFRVGNVTGNHNNEIIFDHGLVLQISDTTILSEWDLLPEEDPFSTGFIELVEVDNDDYLEAIITDRVTDIHVWDVDEQLVKHSFDIESHITEMKLVDLDQNGIFDLVAAEGSQVSLRTFNLVYGLRMWRVEAEGRTLNGFCFGDFDGDNSREIAYTSSCVLYIYDRPSDNYEWSSEYINGPFYALEIEDIDEDGNDELISISHKMDSRYGGQLSVIDLITKEVQFRSRDTLLEDAFRNYNLEIADFGNDGDLDIIVADRRVIKGYIWVIDGDSFSIEKELGLEEVSDEIYALEVEDIDSDDTLEFLAASRNHIYSINSLSQKVEWVVEKANRGISPFALQTGNINADPAKEIVIVDGKIAVFDNQYNQLAESPDEEITAMKLYDWDNDGMDEILSGNYYGELKILKGDDLQVIDSFTIGRQRINGIEVADLNGDDREELIISTNEKVVLMDQDGNVLRSDKLGDEMGRYDAMKVSDYDGDGVYSLFVGSNYRVIEMNTGCARCLPFKVSIRTVDNTCDNESGRIIVASQDTSTEFSLYQNTFEDSLQNLSAGTYPIIAENGAGCKIRSDVSIYTPPPLDLLLTVLEDIEFTPEIDGEIGVEPMGGTPPYRYNWSTGEDTSYIRDLPPGEYELTVWDDNQCSIDTTVTIPEDTTISEEDYIILYPNPSLGTFYLLNKSPGEIEEIQIFTSAGQQVAYSIFPTDHPDKMIIVIHSVRAGYYGIQTIVNGKVYYRPMYVRY